MFTLREQVVHLGQSGQLVSDRGLASLGAKDQGSAAHRDQGLVTCTPFYLFKGGTLCTNWGESSYMQGVSEQSEAL